jgi:hypothetical protein
LAFLDLLIVFVLVWMALSVGYLIRQRRRYEQTARWEARTRALEGGGHVVELYRPGQPVQEVRRISGELDWDELGTELAEGMAEAEARAATLNATVGPPSAPRRRRR